MFYYYGTVISDHITEKPDGGIICTSVPIARIGEMEYLARDLQLDGDPERVVIVERDPEEVFDPAALASFEGAFVTDGHPPENVTAENFSTYSRGHIQGIHREGDYVVGDIHINDKILASEVLHHGKRQISCGYTCIYQPLPDGRYKQVRIRGNHVAVVTRGRAGASVSIHDSAESAGKGKNAMSKFAEAILSAFGMAAKDAKDDQEMSALVTTTMTALDAEPDAKTQAETPATDVDIIHEPKGTDLGEKLDRVLEMLSSLQHKKQEEKALRDEGDLDGLIEKLAGKEEPEASVTLPADETADLSPAARDAAAALLRKVRPAVAAIQNEKERSQVVDALLSTLQGPDVMGQVMQAAAAHARRASDAAPTFEARCRESEAAYAARNPHKKKEE